MKNHFTKKFSSRQKAIIAGVAAGVVLLTAASTGTAYYFSLADDIPAASETQAQTVSVTEPVTESSTESTTESTTVSTTEKVTKPPAAPVTKPYTPKPSAAPLKKPSTPSKSVSLNVPLVYQNPKYPTGCEGASATMLLKYYGYNVSIDEVIAAIPREDLYKENDRVYGPSIYEKFVGDPTKTYTDDRPGYGAFSPVITRALNSVISRKGARHTAKNITGCSFSALLSQLDNNNPVIVWATANMKTPTLVNSWYIKQADGSDKYFEYPRGTHVMVLSGYDSKYVYITDPYYGKVKYTQSAFNDKWVLLGKQAIVLEEWTAPSETETESTTESTTENITESTTENATESTTDSATESTTGVTDPVTGTTASAVTESEAQSSAVTGE